MIGLRDSFTLAGAKLHAHRVRTIITIIISSLLFAALVVSVIVSQGITSSVNSFNREGLNNRYIVGAKADSPLVGDILESKEILSMAQQNGTELMAAKTADAKKLGITYNASDEPSATMAQTMPGQDATTHINMRSDAAIEAVQEYVKQHPSPGLTDLKQAASDYKPIGFYKSTMATIGDGGIDIMPNGKEDLTPTDNESTTLDFFHNTALAIDDSKLTKPFMLSNISINKNDVPLIVSYSTAESLLGLQQLPSSSSSKQRYNRIQQLYKATSGGKVTVTTCYRNSVSQQQISQAVSQAEEISKNKNNSNYQKPDLIYGLPVANSCGQATIISDTRTVDDKKAQEANDQFNADFGQVVAPIQKKLTFQIVGLSPSSSDSSNTTFSDLLSGVIGSNLTNGDNIIPDGLFEKMPNVADIKSILLSSKGTTFGTASSNYYVEFATAAEARSFIKDKSCTTRADGACASPGRLFQLTTSGNNSIALQSLTEKITNIVSIMAIVITLFAAIIMATMVGRTIADSRRETAIFRALGAKRGDIAAVYFMYTACLTALIEVTALIIGIGVAFAFNSYYSQEATLQAKLLFDAVNSNIKFNFFNIGDSMPLLGIVVVAVLLAGLISVLIPLSRNVSRNPINDMREE